MDVNRMTNEQRKRWKFISFIPMNKGTKYEFNEPVVLASEANKKVEELEAVNKELEKEAQIYIDSACDELLPELLSAQEDLKRRDVEIEEWERRAHRDADKLDAVHKAIHDIHPIRYGNLAPKPSKTLCNQVHEWMGKKARAKTRKPKVLL